MHRFHRYYFASRYSRHAELRLYREELQTKLPGTVVTSRWIDCHDGALEASYTPEYLNANPLGCWPYGLADLEDIETADTLVSFTGAGGKGGRHVEHGFALALRLRVLIVGQRENVFHTHPLTWVFPTWDDFLAYEIRRLGEADI